MQSVYIIALVGPPFSGKSSVLRLLKKLPTNKNFKLLFLNETATVFFHGRPEEVSALDSSTLLRQHYILNAQIHSEDILLEYASDSEKPTILITDRGCADAMVYLSDRDFQKLGVYAEALYSRYDHVIFLEGKEDNYRSDSSTTRVEVDQDEIKSISQRTREVWKKHKSFSTINQQQTMEEKAKKAGQTINALIGTEVFVV